MRIPRWLFWFLVYGIATACWAIFFEYGPGTQRFLYGAQRSVVRAFDYVRDAVGGEPSRPAPGLTPAGGAADTDPSKPAPPAAAPAPAAAP